MNSSFAWWLLPIIMFSAVLHIQAEYSGSRRRVYLFKPLTTGLILLFALLIQPPVAITYKILIIAGIVFSIGGDVFLMLPNDRFVYGLVSFLVAHLLYIAAFISLGGFQPDIAALTLYVLYGMAMLRLLWPGLDQMKIPVLIYMVVILVMGWQALALWRLYPATWLWSAAIGAALFVISDSVLAYDRFRSSFVSARAIVLSTYFAAQTLIALSIAA